MEKQIEGIEKALKAMKEAQRQSRKQARKWENNFSSPSWEWERNFHNWNARSKAFAEAIGLLENALKA